MANQDETRRRTAIPSHLLDDLVSMATLSTLSPIHMQGWLVASGCNFLTVRSRLLSGEALDCISLFCVLYPQAHGNGAHQVWWFE